MQRQCEVTVESNRNIGKREFRIRNLQIEQITNFPRENKRNIFCSDGNSNIYIYYIFKRGRVRAFAMLSTGRTEWICLNVHIDLLIIFIQPVGVEFRRRRLACCVVCFVWSLDGLSCSFFFVSHTRRFSTYLVRIL